MTPEQFASLMSEISQIKIAVIVTGVAIIFLCMLAAGRLYSYVKRYVLHRLEDLFRDEGNELIEKGDSIKLKAFAKEKLRERPNHVYAHWYLARALYLEKEWSEALIEFEKTRILAPSWDIEHIEPYVTEIRAQQAIEVLPNDP
jgi:hypothetical protein